MTRAFSVERKNLIVSLAKELYPEMPLTGIADELISRGVVVSPTKLRELLAEAGVHIVGHGGRRERSGDVAGPRPGLALRECDRDLIVTVGREMLPAATVQQVRDEVVRRGLHVSCAAVWNTLNDAGVERGPRHRPRPEPIERVPVQHSPSVAAWMARCLPCRKVVGDRKAEVARLARKFSALDVLTEQQRIQLADAQQNVRYVEEISRACPRCHPHSPTSQDLPQERNQS